MSEIPIKMISKDRSIAIGITKSVPMSLEFL